MSFRAATENLETESNRMLPAAAPPSFEPQLTDAHANRAIAVMVASRDTTPIHHNALPGVELTAVAQVSEAQKVATIDSLRTLLHERFADLDRDGKGGIGLNDLKVAVSNQNYSEAERGLLQFAINNFDKLDKLYPWAHYRPGDLASHPAITHVITDSDLQVMQKAMHPDAETDPWRSDEHSSEALSAGIPATVGVLFGSFGGPLGALAGGVILGGIGAATSLAIQRLIYGSPDTFYSQQRQELLNSVRY
jgi:hypothetical protein